MRKEIEAITESAESVDEATTKTSFFQFSVEDGKIRMVDLNDNVTILEKDDAEDIIKALKSLINKI